MSTFEKKCRALVRKWSKFTYWLKWDAYDCADQLESILPRRKPKKGKR
jgi:hypothetical protein